MDFIYGFIVVSNYVQSMTIVQTLFELYLKYFLPLNGKRPSLQKSFQAKIHLIIRKQRGISATGRQILWTEIQLILLRQKPELSSQLLSVPKPL